MYPVVDPAVAVPVSPHHPKYSSPATAGVRLAQVFVPAPSMWPWTSSTTADAPAVDENSCPAIFGPAGVVPDHEAVTVAVPVDVAMPMNTRAVCALVVPAKLAVSGVQVALVLDRPVQETVALLPLLTSRRKKFPAACGVSESVEAPELTNEPTAENVTAASSRVHVVRRVADDRR